MASERSAGAVLWQCIRYTRFNLLVIAVGVFFLIGAGQGADIVLGLSRGIAQEIALFYFVGRLVDMLEGFDAASGWKGLVAAHGGELLFMALVVLVGRFIVVAFSSLIEEQTVVPGFFSLVRWQAASHVGRQSLSFFQNEFAGRVATKVWQSGQAIGDFMISMLQVAWFGMFQTISSEKLSPVALSMARTRNTTSSSSERISAELSHSQVCAPLGVGTTVGLPNTEPPPKSVAAAKVSPPLVEYENS